MKQLSEDNFLALIAGSQESRNMEFKPGFVWNDAASMKIQEELIKAIIAMSNIPQGGVIILGIHADVKHGKHIFKGVLKNEFESFENNYEHIQSRVHQYCSEPISFSISKVETNRIVADSKHMYLIIQVSEFTIYPTVCVQMGKVKEDNKRFCVLEQDTLYTRPVNAPWSSRKASSTELKEIIHLSADKYKQDLKIRGYVRQDSVVAKLKEERSDYE